MPSSAEEIDGRDLLCRRGRLGQLRHSRGTCPHDDIADLSAWPAFAVGEDAWHYLALPGAVLYFQDNVLTLSTRHYLLDDDYMRISQALQQQLLAEEEQLHTMKAKPAPHGAGSAQTPVGNGPQGRGITTMPQRDELRKQVERQARRMKKAERERPTLIGQTVYIGTLGLLFVLPVVGGAYLGQWLDSLATGYSIRWTMSLILVGCLRGRTERVPVHQGITQ